MASFRNLDSFVKHRHDLRSRSAIGGIITIISTISAVALFIAQIIIYVRGMTLHSLHLSESSSTPLLPPEIGGINAKPYMHDKVGKMPLTILVTFPHLSCSELDFTMNEASLSSGALVKTHGRQSIILRLPKARELNAMNEASNGEKFDTRSMPSSFGDDRKGCTVSGSFRIPHVAGDFTITITRKAWSAATSTLLFGILDISDIFGRSSYEKPPRLQFNMSHYIHKVQFGKAYKGRTGTITGSGELKTNPLTNKWHIVDNKFGGIFLQQIQVRLIPTIYRKFFTQQSAYQMSVVDHTVQPETLVGQGTQMLPGVAVNYDFSPLAVHHVEMRDNIVVFLGSLVSIVGGVFVTVSLVAGCFMNTAAAVAKKLD